MHRVAVRVVVAGLLVSALSAATPVTSDVAPALQAMMSLPATGIAPRQASSTTDAAGVGAADEATDPVAGDGLVELVEAAMLKPEPLKARRVTPPLHLSADGRVIVDSQGRPFFLQGDAAWSLLAELNRDEVDLYLKSRKAAGFNTILASVIEHRFANGAPKNAYDEPPFRVPNDYSTPNDAYFAHVDWVLKRAAAEGFVVLLATSYLGYGGGNEGWYRAMEANGPEVLRNYGRFLGQRYRAFTNIIWLNGGDYDPPNRDLVRAIAEGIREAAPDHLQTLHGGPDTSARDLWDGEPWLRINTVYTYGEIRPEMLRQYGKRPAMPVILLEAMYENEQGADERRLRAQAYHALLSGASGHVFGNNPMWHFDGPGLYPVDTTWHRELTSRGTRSMTHLLALFSRVQWWRLQPDDGHFLKGAHGKGLEDDVAAVGDGGSFAIAYTPTGAALRVDLDRMKGPRVAARWYDPASGRLSPAAPTAPAKGIATYVPPGHNASGHPDWVLVLRSRK